jgi:hypothetical protein
MVIHCVHKECFDLSQQLIVRLSLFSQEEKLQFCTWRELNLIDNVKGCDTDYCRMHKNGNWFSLWQEITSHILSINFEDSYYFQLVMKWVIAMCHNLKCGWGLINGESSRLDLNLLVCVCVHNGELFLSIHKLQLTRFWCIVVMWRLSSEFTLAHIHQLQPLLNTMPKLIIMKCIKTTSVCTKLVYGIWWNVNLQFWFEKLFRMMNI